MNKYTDFYILGILIGFCIGCYVSFIVYCRKLDKVYYETDGSKKGEQK
nr:MAG TPA: WzzE-like protein [Caudoviricetes sp.]